ncbi:MAG: DUF3857 domain-containing protein [Bacteroidales bacterium]|nr:DUF3857 domain-containing protein [Bacteroidales bacterium]
MKFGKIKKENLEMTEYENDPNASAVILFDFGKSYCEYSDHNGFQIFFERHVRVKILDKEGYKWADQIIYLWKDVSIRDKIVELRAFTFNLENGEVVKTKLDKKGIFKEEVHFRLDLKRFTMPNVKEGSILEIKYKIASDFLYIRDWYFQYDIPVIWSEYIVDVPDFFIYKKLHRGYIPLYIYETDRINGILSTSASQNNLFDSHHRNYYHFAMKDVPAFITEQPLSSKENYISKVEFELAEVIPVGGIVADFTSSWKSINKTLLESTHFGLQLKGGGFLNDAVDMINLSETTAKSKMIAAYEYIKNRMRWDEVETKYIRTTLREAHKEQKGNCADINLMLVLLLKKLSIDANPVIISTRKNGFIHPAQPSLTKPNYVIASANINDTLYLMDSTDPLLPCGMLPERALNDKGRIVSWEKSDWIDLTTEVPYEYVTMNTLTLNNKGEFTGSVQCSNEGYAAYDFRDNLIEANGKKNYIEELEDVNEGLDITSYEFTDVDDNYKPVKEKYDVIIADNVEISDDLIYFNPMFYDAITENPLTLEERLYPIEYPYPENVTYMLNFTIPEGYKAEELPEDAVITLPGNAAKFIYKTTVLGNMIQIISKYNITKELFIPDEYDNLKEFYNMIIAKHAEQIVLKKDSE